MNLNNNERIHGTYPRKNHTYMVLYIYIIIIIVGRIISCGVWGVELEGYRFLQTEPENKRRPQ